MYAIPQTAAWPERQKRWLCAIAGVALLGAAVVYANKASRNASAILRWRDLIQSVARGDNVYNEWTKDGSFPYPPIAGILLWPLTQLPPIATALTWFVLKLVMAAVAIRWSIRLATKPRERFAPWQFVALVALAGRPLLSDLQHGNINILILFLTTAGLIAYRHSRDAIAGAAIGLAAAIKVTPLLFIPYFAWKRQWHIVACSLSALAIFWFVIPGLFLGFERSVWLIRSWSGAMIEPYMLEGKVETIQSNQSLPGVVLRLITQSPGIELDDGTQLYVNWLNVPPRQAHWMVKIILLGIVGWIAWLARQPASARCDSHQSLEYAMVFIAMLLISERSWKHHFVTMTLPYAVLVAHAARNECSPNLRRFLWAILAGAFLLMASTSTELGGWLAGGTGHKYAQAYGMFCATAVLSLVALSLVRLNPARTPVVAGLPTEPP